MKIVIRTVFFHILCIVIFGLLYVIILLIVPDKIGVGATNFLSNFTGFSVYSSILFLLFLIIITVIITTYPGGFFNKSNSIFCL